MGSWWRGVGREQLMLPRRGSGNRRGERSALVPDARSDGVNVVLGKCGLTAFPWTGNPVACWKLPNTSKVH